MAHAKNQMICSDHLINDKMQYKINKKPQKVQLCFQFLKTGCITEERKFIMTYSL